jgi:acyl-coenzyme A synthetase/AMP-(fatty) acid ligase
MLEVDGMRVSPMEVEICILQHPAVLEVVVVGATDKQRGTKPKAFIVLRTGFVSSAELAIEIQDFTRSKIEPYKCPHWVQFLPGLPKTATGKIERYKLGENGINT